MNKELQKLRKEREGLWDKPSKPQKRVIEIKEFEDGSYLMTGFAWELILKKKEVKEAVDYWLKGELEKT